MLSIKEYIDQLLALKDQYQKDNEWIGKWKKSWNDPAHMAQYINFGYQLYEATASNALRLTLLGGTEIRLDNAYIRNFGVTGVNGIQDTKTKELVKEELQRRGQLASNPHAQASNPDLAPASVTRTGSILSEEGWTPILNDSLIIGAITAGQDFYLALTPEEQKAWNAMTAAKQNGKAALVLGMDTSLLGFWKAFFNTQQQMFFDVKRGVPRVFTRELLGLSFFGYQPEFSWHQLGFSSREQKERPDFKTYLAKLREVHFEYPTDKSLIMQTLSTFLFKDPKAIGTEW